MSLSKIPENLIEKVGSIPVKPGVYQMKDVDGNIIYIGKSKTLKSRVKSYFHTEHKWNKVKRMVFHIHDIDYIVTDTHLEAQLLECALIKKLQPIYNKQFKNDKNYRYLKVENYNKFKSLSIAYERESKNCFGPYRSKKILYDVIDFFRNIYPITKCEDIYEFTYKILPQPMERDDFEKNKESLIEIFSNREYMMEFLSKMEEKMNEAALELQFELASTYRDMLEFTRYLYDYNKNQTDSLRDKKVLMGEKIEDGYKIFYISNYRIISKKKYIKLTRESIEEFLAQAQELEIKLSHVIDEKRDLDFKKIIQTEIKDETSKVVVFVDSHYSVDEFISRLNIM